MTEFRLLAPALDGAANRVRLRYQCPRFGAFEETVIYPACAPLAAIDAPVREGLMALASVLVATSYYKAAPCAAVRMEFGLPAAGRALAALAFGPGLGEFYIRNGLAYPPDIIIESEHAPDRPAPVSGPGRSAAAAFGGGKDSHVAAAILGEAGVRAERVSVILSDPVGARLQAMSEAPVTLIRRVIDPRLIEINLSGEALNGHVPITGINSCLLALYAAARGLDQVVFANERAASEPTMEANGHPVNHQFSKSLAFEDALRAAFAAAGAGLDYYSILRPVSEVWTAHYLATRAAFALPIFASCNRNFVFAGEGALAPGRRWCGTCAKCVYTGVLLAPFLDPQRHETVFQSRPLHDRANAGHLRDIAGLTHAKPWECVGERREVAACLHHLIENKDWREAPLIAEIAGPLYQRWDRADLQAAWDSALSERGEHRMAPVVAKVMSA